MVALSTLSTVAALTSILYEMGFKVDDLLKVESTSEVTTFLYTAVRTPEGSVL